MKTLSIQRPRPVHRDANVGIPQSVRERKARELRALIRVEDRSDGEGGMAMSGAVDAVRSSSGASGVLVALLSPWVGFYSEKWGRQPLLLVGFALEIVRAVLFAFSTDYAAADAVIETIGLPSVALRHRERSR